jgi:hypothetical protein
MASSKFYAYYVRGRKIALVQHDYTLGSGQTLSQPGLNAVGARGDVLWKSPTEDVTSGLEIEYTYSPIFNLQSTGIEGSDFHKFLGWGSDGTNLLLFTFGSTGVTDLSASGLDFGADDWIYVKGSSRWSGLHQVKSTGGTTGILTLKTKCNLKPSKVTIVGTFATDETFNGDDSANDLDIEVFKDLISTYDGRETPYIFIDAAVDGPNNGVFSVTYGSTSGEITFGNKITIDADGDYTSAAADLTGRGSDSVAIYNMFYEQISVFEDVEVLNPTASASPETFELDISRYQANALVYYLKAKMAEDAGDIEKKEYNMREFKRLLEKNESSKIWGARRIGTDETAIR